VTDSSRKQPTAIEVEVLNKQKKKEFGGQLLLLVQKEAGKLRNGMRGAKMKDSDTRNN